MSTHQVAKLDWTVCLVFVLNCLIFPPVSAAQTDSLQKRADAEDLEWERYQHESMLQQQMIDTLNRLFGQQRATEVKPDLDGMLVKRDCDLFQLTMLNSIMSLRPTYPSEWRPWAATLASLAHTQTEPQLRHLELQALSFTLVASAGNYLDQDATALAKQSPDVRAEITKSCSADEDAFIDMVVPCWYLKPYMEMNPSKLDNHNRPTGLDAPEGFYRVDTLKIDTSGLRLKNGKWIDQTGTGADLDKRTAHTLYDVPKNRNARK